MSTEARPFLEALDQVSDAVESGAGLPAVARAASRALDASVIVLDRVRDLVEGLEESARLCAHHA